MMKAIWNDVVLAESNDAFEFDGYYYFPEDSVQRLYLLPSSRQSQCFWKGTANYFTLEVHGKTNPNAAWHYPAPSAKASRIAGHIGFWQGVQIIE
jgi:uncharacterized protein (DUF427 family)